MKQRSTMLIIVGTTLFLGACGPSETDVPVTRYLDDFEDHVAALETGLSAHAADIGSAATLTGMMDIEDGYAGDAQMHMGAMTADMEHMGMCTNADGHSPDMSGMEKPTVDMMEEQDEHEAAMKGAGDMAAAQQEEARHQTAMADLIDMMMEAKDHMTDQEMMAGSGMHMCGGSMGHE